MRSLAALLALLVIPSLTLCQQPSQEFLRDRMKVVADPIGYLDDVQAGVNAYGASKFPEAVAALRKAVASYPDDGLVWLYLGLSEEQVKHFPEAANAYRTALRLHSSGQPHRIYVWLARTLLAQGDKEGAYSALHSAIFDEPHVGRQSLYDNPAFASLKGEKRFQDLTGHIDTSRMSRDQGWRTDLDYLVEELTRVNHLYKTHPLPNEFTDRYKRLKRDIPKLTDDQIYVGMNGMLATLHQGHVSLHVFPTTKHSPLETLPVQFYAFPEGIFLVGADAANKDLIGDQVLKIENSDPVQILQQVEEHSSTEDPTKILWGGMQPLGMLQVLRGLGVLKDGSHSARLTLHTPDGKTVERTLSGVNATQERKLVPPPTVPTPLFLRDVPRSHWMQPLPEDHALWIQLNQVAPDPGETMQQFGEKVRKELEEHPVKNVILDVRHNNGGNTVTYTPFLRALVAFSTKPGNHLYVIIGRGVYSATGNLITDIERLAGPTFVGEPSSGFGNQDGDESSVDLPYSGLHAFLTSVWWQYSHPWDKRHSIIPDVPVQLTAADYFAGKDPCYEAIKALIHRTKD